MIRGTRNYKRMPWCPLRSNVADDDTTLITTFERDNATYLAGKWDIPRGAASIVIAFWGKNAANDDGDYKLFGRARTNGPIEAIAAGAIVLGTQLITDEPILLTAEVAYWVDSITNTVEWIKTPVIKNNANNTIAYLCIDAKHLADVYLEFTDVGGAGIEMEEVNAIIAGLED